jgi:hypothetical protein
MYLCEQGTLLQNLWFREVRSLLESGHQTAIMTTHPTLEVPIIAKDMFSRWTQENYFKYAVANFDLDYMTTYIHENADTETKVVNPEYRELTNKISKTTYKKKRIQANISEMSNNMDINSVDLKKIDKINTLIEQVKIYDEEINELRTNRKQMKNKLTVGELPEEMRYNILNKESKKLKNIIVMLAYRAESTLKNIVNEIYKYSNKEGRILLKQIFVTDADIKVDKENKTLTVTLHTMSTTRHNTMVVNLCQVLNESEVYYPGTDLRLIYKSHAF